MLTARIDLQALKRNLDLIRTAVGAGVEIIGCMKANAYGHGSVEVARCLESEGVCWLAVGAVREALALRKVGIACSVLLFPPVATRDCAALSSARVTMGVESWEDAQRIQEASEHSVEVFLEVDAGFGRCGAPLECAAQVAERINRELPKVCLRGVYTHLPFRSRDQIPWVESRLGHFGRVATDIARGTAGRHLIVQALSSPGIVAALKAPEANAVCPGQLLFGLEPAWTGQNQWGTMRVLIDARTTVGTLRTVPPDTAFGVGGSVSHRHQTVLAVLPIGYSNSLLVAKGGQYAYVEGKRCPLLSVGLEHSIVDLTAIRSIGDKAVVWLLDRDGQRAADIDDWAEIQQRSRLEIMVSLNRNANYEYVGTGSTT